jgi:exopolysaccharide/PEP-CTERM locus tyrosine autokinase
MSLIERAVDKLGAGRPEPGSPTERAGQAGPIQGAAGPLIEEAMARAGNAAARLPGPVNPSVRSVPAAPGGSQPDAPAMTTVSAPAAPQPPAGRTPPAVTIQLEPLRARGFVMPDGTPSVIGQEFRVIKRPLLTNAFGRGGSFPLLNGRRVMVTSAFPGEGKSFCAINLALSIASERDHQVLLVDADVARPSIPRELGIVTGAGLMDWLIDGSPDIASLVVPTNIENLSLLPAGRRDDHATELIASQAMNRLLEELSTRFPDRVIIFDSPPLLITTESRVLASYMGQIVMVVEAGKTPRESVKDALATLGTTEVVGLVLNKSRETRAGNQYGYQGYGYGAG